MEDKIYTCRHCKKTIIAKPEEKDVTWLERSKNFYYHTTCWNEFLNKAQEKDDDLWFDLIFVLITKELKCNYNFFKIKAQTDKFLKQGLTMKGIYFTLYWYHKIKKEQYNETYGIGIVPFVYEEATTYWVEQVRKTNDIMEEIQRIQTIELSKGTTIKQKARRRTKKEDNPEF